MLESSSLALVRVRKWRMLGARQTPRHSFFILQSLGHLYHHGSPGFLFVKLLEGTSDHL